MYIYVHFITIDNWNTNYMKLYKLYLGSCLIKFILVTSILISCKICCSQPQMRLANSSGLQYGFSVKASLVLGKFSSNFPSGRFAINTGIGKEFKIGNITSIFPTWNIEAQIYYRGFGAGNSRNNRFNIDLTYAFTNHFALLSHKDILQKTSYLQENNSPAYFFHNFTNPCLQNPFKYSMALGVNFITFSNRNKISQRVGFFNFKFDKFQGSYFNDGGKGLDLIGDGKDRYYTGGVLFSYALPSYTKINQFDLSYLKFTGFDRNAFETANTLGLSYVFYNNIEQSEFNTFKWSISANLLKNTSLLNLDFNNYEILDLQHWIHNFIYNSYHYVPYSKNVSMGISWLNNRNYFTR